MGGAAAAAIGIVKPAATTAKVRQNLAMRALPFKLDPRRSARCRAAEACARPNDQYATRPAPAFRSDILYKFPEPGRSTPSPRSCSDPMTPVSTAVDGTVERPAP